MVLVLRSPDAGAGRRNRKRSPLRCSDLLVATWYRDAMLSGVDRLWRRLSSREWCFYAVVFAKALFVAIVLTVLWGLETNVQCVSWYAAS